MMDIFGLNHTGYEGAVLGLFKLSFGDIENLTDPIKRPFIKLSVVSIFQELEYLPW